MENVEQTAANVTNSTKEFLESNSLIAKAAFLILVIIVFMILLKLGLMILEFIMTPSGSPHIIDGTIEGSNQITITQDPKMKNSIPILRSNNATQGIVFTWSVWLLIDGNSINTTTSYTHIFSKGNNNTNYCTSSNCLPGIFYPNNSPGMYLAPNQNDLLIIMNTFNEINNTVTIQDVPLNKWFNVIMICENNQLDVYINGFVTSSTVLNGVPKQNYGDVYLGGNGLQAQISNLWYWDKALTISEIQNIMKMGPNLKMLDENTSTTGGNNYLSLRWYFNGLNNEYIP